MSTSVDNWFFSDSNSVSFGVASGSVLTASISTLPETPFALSAGIASISSGTVVFSNSNNVSFGVSLTSIYTASASFPAETPFGVSAGTQSVSTGTLVYSNSNGISFGMSGSSRVTASADYVRSISAGTTNATGNQIVFNNGSNVSFGADGATITASVLAETPFGVSAGTQSVSTGTLVFSNSNNITFGMSGSSRVTASVGNLTGDYYANVMGIAANNAAIQSMAFTGSAGSMPIGDLDPKRLPFPFNMTANTMMLMVSISGSSATQSLPYSSSFYFALYTLNAGTLSLLNSVSSSIGTGIANLSLSLSNAGVRFLSFHSSQWSVQPTFVQGSRYFYASSWSSSSILNQTGGIFGVWNFSSYGMSGTMGTSIATATSMGANPFTGIFSTTSNAFPVSINIADINRQTGGTLNFVPYVQIFSNTGISAF